MSRGKLIRIEGPRREQNTHHASGLVERLRESGQTDAERVCGPFATAASAAIHSVLRNWGQTMAPERQVDLWAISMGEVYDKEIAPRLDDSVIVVENPDLITVIAGASEAGIQPGRVAEAMRRHINPAYLEPDALFCLYRRGERNADMMHGEAARTEERYKTAELSLRGICKMSVCADDATADIDEKLWQRTSRLL